MSNNEHDDEEAAVDREKAQCRRNRRPSVQFIDKNLIRRRSSGNEKSAQRLATNNSTFDNELLNSERNEFL
jgi:hypothetical protein